MRSKKHIYTLQCIVIKKFNSETVEVQNPANMEKVGQNDYTTGQEPIDFLNK